MGALIALLRLLLALILDFYRAINSPQTPATNISQAYVCL